MGLTGGALVGALMGALTGALVGDFKGVLMDNEFYKPLVLPPVNAHPKGAGLQRPTPPDTASF